MPYVYILTHKGKDVDKIDSSKGYISPVELCDHSI